MSSAISRTTASDDEMKMIAVSSWSRSSCIRRRIWAATVTSSCCVTLSAIRKAGLLTSASTISARCIMPPEYWNGNSSKRCSGRGMCTERSTSSARARAAAPDISGSTARSFSTIWWPTGMVGSSALPGSEPI